VDVLPGRAVPLVRAVRVGQGARTPVSDSWERTSAGRTFAVPAFAAPAFAVSAFARAPSPRGFPA
jgi:hypothetical protein